MNMKSMLMIAALGAAGYFAWKKMNSTKTIVVSDTTKDVVGAYTNRGSQYLTADMAGWR